MKRNKLSILIPIFLTFFSLSTFGQAGTISFSQYCYANIPQTWNININEHKAVRINYSIDCTLNSDLFALFDNSSSSMIFYTNGFRSGTTCTIAQTGIATIVFTPYTSGYKTINVIYAADNPLIVTSELSVAGNANIFGKLNVNQSIEVGSTYKTKIMDFPGHTTWIDLPVVSGKATGIGSGGPGQNAWIAYAGNATQWFTNSSMGDICYRNLNGRLLFGNQTQNSTMAISGNKVGIGTNSPKALLDVYGKQMTGTGSQTTFLSNNTLQIQQNANTETSMSFWQNGVAKALIGSKPNDSRLYFTNDNNGGGLGDANHSITLDINGKVGIGTTTPDSLLTVKGGIHARSVIIDMDGALVPDFVFDPTYNLMPLTQVEQFVKTNRHLPLIPSATEVQEKGMNMGEMQNKLLQKIEELTLYVIEQQKRIEQLEKNQK
ncbi:MAG TPA: tail fiber protein [Paludibacter sp.]|nr:tail fiber protein [Paludibacter sp.]